MLSAASCRSCGEAKGPCGFGSSQWKRARANKPAICKACALDAENAAPQAVDKAAVLAAFLLRESEGAVDGKKRTVRGVARRAAKPSKEAGKGGRALYDGLRERYDLSAFSS